MLTLPDPKHEAFATLRASGHDLASAYVHAGYSVKNIKERSRKLVRNPDIQARIAHLKSCLPRINELHNHHCPNLLLMPETRHEMLVWLWQVMNGTRLVKPAQMRAAGLYCRLQGWNLAKLLPQTQSPKSTDAADKPPIPSATLTEAEKVFLASSNRENIANERTCKPRSPENLTHYQSTLADLAHPACRLDTFGLPIPNPVPEPIAASPSVRPDSLVRPILPSTSTPAAHDCETANPAILSKSPSETQLQNPLPVNPANLVILSKIPLPNPHPKPLTLNPLPLFHPQPRHFLNSSPRTPLAPPPPIPKILRSPRRRPLIQ